jgi:hypothetical protein
MREWKTRCHVKAELIIVVHVLVSNLNQLVSTLDNNLLLKNRVNHGINFVFDGLDQDREAFLEWPFQSISKIWMVECHDTILFFKNWLSSSNPMNGLTLRINHQRISR